MQNVNRVNCKRFVNKGNIYHYIVGGGVLDAPQVCIADHFRAGGRSRSFVGRGLDPSWGDNPNPVRGVGDAAPYGYNFVAAKDSMLFTMAKCAGEVKPPPYNTSGSLPHPLPRIKAPLEGSSAVRR